MSLSRVSLVILTGSSLLSAGTLFTVGLVPNHQRTRDVIVYRLDAAGQTLHSSSVRRVPVRYPAHTSLVSRIEVEVEGRGDFLTFGAGTLASPDHLVPVPGFISIPLEDGRESEILPVSVLANPRVEGLVGDQFPESSYLTPNVAGNPLRLHGEGWKSVSPPFPTVFVRSFRYWLAFPAAEPAPGTEIPIGPSTVRRAAGGVQAGDESKRLHAMVSFRTSANDLLLMSGHSRSGALYVYNVKTGAHFLIETREADSEVLLVDDASIIYRINDQIKQAPINGGAVGPSTILAIGDAVSGVHWAFRGPQKPAGQ